MKKLLILIGASGSGKSTFARDFISKNKGWIAVSRDKIREQLFSYSEESVSEYYKSADLNKNENLVTKYLYNQIRYSLTEGLNVVVDNTHLKAEYIKPLLIEFGECEISFEVMKTSLEDCIARINARTRKVDPKIIEAQYKQQQSLIKSFDLSTRQPSIKPIVFDKELPDCVIFDIDGTLSDSSHRHIFSDKDEEILEDKVIAPVQRIAKLFEKSHDTDLIFVSGRSDKYEAITLKWLKERVGISDPIIYMREEGDFRKDTIVKEEILEEIAKDYNVLLAIDDRLSVTRHLRKLGIFVLNVNQTDKEF